MTNPAASLSSPLSGAFAVHVELVQQQRSAGIPPELLERYLSLGWLRWGAGRLLVTLRGAAVRDAEIEDDATA
jgi:hypothetical protein